MIEQLRKHHYLHIILYRKRATPFALLSGSGSVSCHFENKSTRVTIYLLPLGVSGSGPIRSIPTYIKGIVQKPTGYHYVQLFIRL